MKILSDKFQNLVIGRQEVGELHMLSESLDENGQFISVGQFK